MFRCGLWILTVMVAVGAPLAHGGLGPGIGFQPVSPDELKMTSEPLAPGAPAVVLYRQVDRDDSQAHPHQDDYYRIKILTEEGRKQADIEIPFFKQAQEIIHVHARTIRPDGSIVNFDGNVFEKNLVKAKGVKYLAKTFTLPEVQVGSVIEYFYTVDFKNDMIPDSHWILSEDLFTRRAEFSLKPYASRYVNLTLRWTWQQLPPGATVNEGPDHIVRMQANNIPAFQTEDFMPPENELKARVDFIYEIGLPEKDTRLYWRRVGQQWNHDLEEFIGKRKAMEQAAAQIVAAGDTPEVKLRKIYDRVQQIRNTSYEVQKTEQEEKRSKEKTVENVEELWKRGYGTANQLTWLFLALARAAGFDAYGCWVSDRRYYFFDPSSMQGSKLNANVVLVKLNGKDLYFDPGAAFTPYGLLTWSETGVRGLRLDKDGGSWIQTTLPEAAQSRVERKGLFKLTETGDLEGKLTVTSTGLEAMYNRIEMRNSDAVARKKFLEDLVAAQIPVAAEVELTNQPDWSNSNSPLVGEFNLRISGWASSAGRRVLVPAAIFSAGEKGLFDHANRVHPIYFEYPHQKEDAITIELPLGWQVSSVPAPQNQDQKLIAYKLQVGKNGGNLELTREFTIDFIMLDAKFYGALQKFFSAIRTSDGGQIIVQPGEIHASN
jgi:hypothetical protein